MTRTSAGRRAASVQPRIRPRKATDRSAWLRLRSRLWPHASRPRLRREMAEYEAEPERLAVFVAEGPDAQLLGFLEVSLRPSANGCDGRPVGYLEGWFVIPSHRRSGVGRALVAAGEAWARGHGATWMASDAYRTNRASRAAHAHVGYEEWVELVHFRKRLGRSGRPRGRGTSPRRRAARSP